jgi:hypothetical protein
MGVELISSTLQTSTTFVVPSDCGFNNDPTIVSLLYVVVNGIPSRAVAINGPTSPPTAAPTTPCSRVVQTFVVYEPATCTPVPPSRGKGNTGKVLTVQSGIDPPGPCGGNDQILAPNV